jgi:hypothetical protein
MGAILPELELSSVYFSHENTTAFANLLSPNAENIFLVVDVTLLLHMFFFHFMMWVMLRREKQKKGQHLIKNLLECYVMIVPLSYFVIGVYINVLTRFSDAPSVLIGPWFCNIFELFGHADIVYLGGFSLFVSGVKYWFIVKNSNAKNFGEEKARKIFLISHFALPTVMSGLNSISNGHTDQVFWVNHCWGLNPASQNITDNGVGGNIGDLFCGNRQYEIPEYFQETTRNIITTSLRATCGTLKVLYMLFLSNMAEFIIYILLFRYLNR